MFPKSKRLESTHQLFSRDSKTGNGHVRKKDISQLCIVDLTLCHYVLKGTTFQKVIQALFFNHTLLTVKSNEIFQINWIYDCSAKTNNKTIQMDPKPICLAWNIFSVLSEVVMVQSCIQCLFCMVQYRYHEYTIQLFRWPHFQRNHQTKREKESKRETEGWMNKKTSPR